jgi:hypothetical protein
MRNAEHMGFYVEGYRWRNMKMNGKLEWDDTMFLFDLNHQVKRRAVSRGTVVLDNFTEVLVKIGDRFHNPVYFQNGRYDKNIGRHVYPACDLHVGEVHQDENQDSAVLITYFGATSNSTPIVVELDLSPTEALKLASGIIESVKKLEKTNDSTRSRPLRPPQKID